MIRDFLSLTPSGLRAILPSWQNREPDIWFHLPLHFLKNQKPSSLGESIFDFLENGRPFPTLDEELSVPIYVTDIIEFSWRNQIFSKDAALEEYVENRLSVQEVADKFGCAKSTVLKYLKQHGIKTRKPSRPIAKTSGSLRYGEKLRQRQVLAHKREQENIAKMIELRDKGFNNEQIAQAFNSMKIPTKKGKGAWHRRTIHAILARHEDRSSTENSRNGSSQS